MLRGGRYARFVGERRPATEDRERAQRHPGKTALLGRIGKLAVDHPRMLTQSRRVRATCQVARGQRSSAFLSFHEGGCSGESAAVDRRLVGLQRIGAACEQCKDRLGREACGDEALVHPVARDRVDQTGGVPRPAASAHWRYASPAVRSGRR